MILVTFFQLTGKVPEAEMRLSVRIPVSCRKARREGRPLTCSSSVRRKVLGEKEIKIALVSVPEKDSATEIRG